MELETEGKFNVLPPRPYASGRLHIANQVHAQCTVTVTQKNFFTLNVRIWNQKQGGNLMFYPPVRTPHVVYIQLLLRSKIIFTLNVRVWNQKQRGNLMFYPPVRTPQVVYINQVHAQCTVTVVIRKQIAVRTYFVHSSPHALKHTLAPRGLVSKQGNCFGVLYVRDYRCQYVLTPQRQLDCPFVLRYRTLLAYQCTLRIQGGLSVHQGIRV